MSNISSIIFFIATFLTILYLFIFTMICRRSVKLQKEYEDRRYIKVDLKGWADGIEGYRTVKFVLSLALANVTGDTDYIIDVKACVGKGDVRHPYDIDVIAKRYHYSSYVEGRRDRFGVTEYEFSFQAQALSKRDIYHQAIEVLKNTKPAIYEIDAETKKRV